MEMRDLLPTKEIFNKVIGNTKINHDQTTTVCSTVFEYKNGAKILL